MVVGFCPGPGISSLAYCMPESLVFVAAMVAGSAMARYCPAAPIPALVGRAPSSGAASGA